MLDIECTDIELTIIRSGDQLSIASTQHQKITAMSLTQLDNDVTVTLIPLSESCIDGSSHLRVFHGLLTVLDMHDMFVHTWQWYCCNVVYTHTSLEECQIHTTQLL